MTDINSTISNIPFAIGFLGFNISEYPQLFTVRAAVVGTETKKI